MSNEIPSGPVLFKTHVSYGGGVRASAEKFDGGAISLDILKDTGLSVVRHPSGGSLLAASFNAAWCTALNLQEAGWDIRYFVMLHDDIVPQDNWIGILMEDIESSGADMVSAVVPLKEPTGNTSTAVDLEDDHYADGGHWGVQRRVTLKEAHKIAKQTPVFTAEDCGYQRRTIANTGCWICRFDRPWRNAVDEFGRKKLFFTINDRIARDPTTNLWKPDVEPEDWFFSRRLQDLGGKVAITTRVRLAHYGMTPYANFPNAEGEIYGDVPYDQAHEARAGYKAIGDGPTENTSYDSKELADVVGFMNDDEGRLLAKHADGKRVLEIGSYYGRSTIWMARTAENVLAVDTWDTGGTGKDTLEGFLENVNRYELCDKISVSHGTLQEVKRANGRFGGSDWYNPEFGPFDFIFIDANHDFAAVQSDIEESLPLLEPGGLIAFHDYDRPTDPGVKQAVDLLISGGATVVERVGTVIILRVTNGEPSEKPEYTATGDAGDVYVTECSAGPVEFSAVCALSG
jgi:predicted O-methyltransferase YrrM